MFAIAFASSLPIAKKFSNIPGGCWFSSPPSDVVVVPVVVVVVRIVIVHSAVHSKLWVPFND